MGLMLSQSELLQTAPAERTAFRSPVPTQIVSNGEFNPLPQTAQQRRVECRIKELADRIAPKLGLNRSQFLRTGCGMAAAFLAMNDEAARFWTIRETRALDERMPSAQSSTAAQDSDEETSIARSPEPQIRPRIYPGL